MIFHCFVLCLAEALEVIGIENQESSFNAPPQRTKRQTKEQLQSFSNEERRVAGVSSQYKSSNST